MRKWVLLGLYLLIRCSLAHAANETTTDMTMLLRQRMAEVSAAFVITGCAPTVPVASLTFAAFACDANVLENGFSIPVRQAAAALGPLNQGDGQYFLAIHKDTTSTVSGYTRQRGTHYLWQKGGTPAAQPAVLQLGYAAVESGAITRVTLLGRHAPGGADVPPSNFGIVCDGSTDTAPMIQTAITTLPKGSHLTLPPGDCVLQSTVTVTQPLTIRGAGLGLTHLRHTQADAPVLVVDSPLVTLSGLYLTHVGVNPVAGGDGLVVHSGHDGIFLDHLYSQFNYRGFVLGSIAYGNATHLIASLNNSHGFEFLYNVFHGNQWDVLSSISQQNKGAGFAGQVQLTDTTGLGPFLTQTTSFANNQGGYVFLGQSGHPLYDVRLNNVLSSYDNEVGIYLDTYGASHTIVNPWIELTGQFSGPGVIGADMVPYVGSQTGHCLAIGAHNGPGVVITGGIYWNCSWSGVALDAPYTSLIGGASYDNGAAMDANLARRAGVAIGNTGVTVSGHVFDTSGGARTQHYIWLSGSIAGVAIGHNTYNPLVLDPSQFLGVDAGTVFSGTVANMIGGLVVHTNRPGAPALTLYDASSGAAATPLKLLRVTQGQLQVDSADGGTILSTLSDAGTPGWPQRRGQVTIADANTTGTVTLTPVEPDTNYFVQLTPVTIAGTPAAAASTVQSVSKGGSSFVLTLLGAPGAGTSVTYDWLVYR